MPGIGSRSTANGYATVFVGHDHHLANGRGYAYEHRIIAERKLGRALTLREVVHHIDGDKTNNAIENLAVSGSQSEHVNEHQPKPAHCRQRNEANPWVECACGCGQLLLKYNGRGRPRKYQHGHWMVNGQLDPSKRKAGEANPLVECECGCGQMIRKYGTQNRRRRFARNHSQRRFRQADAAHRACIERAHREGRL